VAARTGRRSGGMTRQETRWAWLFLAPWVIGFVVFTGGPMIASLVLSFTEYDVISPPQVVGLENYRQLISDPAVAKSLGNTVFYTALHVPLAMAVSLGLALLLLRVGRASGVFRTIFYLPVMTPAVAVGILFLFLLNGQRGLINGMLGLVGIQGPNWTTDPAWIKPGIVLMSLWTLGSTTIIYLAALNNVPKELYEAARIDGASYLQLFRKIALPLTRPALIVTFIFEFRASWTDLMRPLIYLRDGSLFTLPRGLKVVLDQFGQGGEGQWEVVLAASVIATVPMLIIFFLGQRHFVEGIATTGRKG
jgi:multiple sugar transport system permease protein